MAGLDLVNLPWPLDSHSPPLPALSAAAESSALSASAIQIQPSLQIYSSRAEAKLDAPANSLHQPPIQRSETPTSAIAQPATVSPKQYFDLLEQLAQARSLECQHLRRIYHLEQALDQALICLDELRAKVRDHDNLQSQLSITEDFAYVQQHAIARLKAQIQEQKQAIISQNADAHDYDEAVQMVLSYTERLAEYQQIELEHLKVRLARDQVEEQQRRQQLENQVQRLQSALSTQQDQIRQQEAEALAARTLSASLNVQLEASQQQVKHLSTRLAESQTQLSALQEHVDTLAPLIDEKTRLQDALQRAQRVISEQNHDIATLKRDAALATSQTEWMQQQQQQQLREQNRWQHRCLMLEQERDRHIQRSQELMQQTAEMQEDILQYARQAGEYEAAVQFWKDRYQASQQQLTQLKDLLERQAPYLSDDDAVELYAALELTLASTTDDPPSPAALPAPQFSALEIPEFLLRRYALRNTRRARSTSASDLTAGDTPPPDETAAG